MHWRLFLVGLVLSLLHLGTVQGQDEVELPPSLVVPDESLAGPTTPIEATLDAIERSVPLSERNFGQQDGFGENTGISRSATNLLDAPYASEIVDGRRIREKLAPDMFHALQNEVGVLMQATGAGQASPFVRGLTGQQVLILVDGIRLNNSIFRFGPNQYFNTIDPGMVDHIEVVRGSGSTLWGSDAIGGVINVVTRAPSIHGAGCDGYQSAEFHQYVNTANISPYSRANVEGWVGSVGAFGGGSFLNVRDLDTGWDAIGRQPGTNYQQYAGDIKMNILLDESQLVTIAAQHHVLQDVIRSDRFPGFPGDRNNSNTLGGARFFDPQQRTLAYIRYQAIEPFAWSDAVTITGSYHRQRDNQKRGVPESRFQETDVNTFGVNIVSSKRTAYGRVMTGVDWYHDNVDSKFGGSASGPIIPDDAYYDRFGWFIGADAQLTDKLLAHVAARYERIKLAATPVVNGNDVFISPRYDDWVADAGLVYKLNECARLVGSVRQGFRAPNLDELTANNPNVLQNGMDLPSLGLIPETSLNYEVGVKTDYEGLRAQAYYFWIDLDNNIVPISAGSNQFRRANQDSIVNGVELNGEVDLTEYWSLYGNFWYTYGLNEITSAPLSRIPPTQGMLGLRWEDEDAYVDVWTWLVKRQDRLDPVRDVSDERIPIGGTPGYGTVNLRTGRVFGDDRQHRVSMSLENLTDQPYLVHGSGVFGTGITGRFGYSFVY